MFNVKESFEWMTPEFKIVDSGKNTIRIKGVAMRGNVVSRNKRRYVADELKRAARTFVGKPITINHDPSKRVGHVVWMEYSDQNDALEYLGDVKKQPYVDMLRNGSTYVKGVSVEADYLHNQCPKCGQRFYTEEEFHSHMHGEHFIKTDPTHEPHGIIGQALSLVLSPEEPGYPDTTIELMEFYRAKPILQLLETVTTYGKEQFKMTKTKEQKVKPTKVPYKTAEHLVEQDETPECPEGQHRNEEGDCVPDAPTEETVTEQEGPSSTSVNVPPESEGEPSALACAAGFHLETDDQGNQHCVPDLPPPPVDKPVAETEAITPVIDVAAADVQQIEACPEGQVRDSLTGLCISPTAVVEPLPNVAETKIVLPRLLKFDEGCQWSKQGFSSGDSCVSQMRGKVDDPEAYCYNKAGETLDLKENVYDANKQLFEALKKADGTTLYRDVQLSNTVNLLNRAVAQVAVETPKNVSEAIKQVAEILRKELSGEKRKTVKAFSDINALRETVTKQDGRITSVSTGLQEAWNKNLNASQETVIQNKTFVVQKLGELATDQAKTKQANDTKLNQLTAKLEETKQVADTKLSELASTIEKLNELATTQKKDFEAVLAFQAKNYDRLAEEKKDLEEYKRLKEEEEQKCPPGQHRDEEGNCVDDQTTEEVIAKKLAEMLEPYKTKIENLEARQKGNFKGSTKPDVETGPEQTGEISTFDPYKKQ